jgi:gamma-glutamyltranspeptidase/glutathione hydrolase
VVAGGHESVSAAAAELLEGGGNAFDAAAAAGFAACVAEPMFTSLGGGGFLLAHSASGRASLHDFFVDAPGRGLDADALEPHFLPFTVRFPASEQVFNMGLGSVATPATLRGLLHVHEALGRAPLSRVVEPAARLARAGLELNEHQAYVQGLLFPMLTLTPAGRAIYAPEGRGLRAGDRLVNADLAAFLDELPADRGRDFYEGSLARAIARDMREGQGLLTAEDLAGYRVLARKPLEFAYRGHRILTNPRPARGGELIAFALAELERGGDEVPDWGSADHAVALAGAMEAAERSRGAPAAGGTTHVSVADAEGNAASLSLSNGEGSGYIAPGTGILLNNMLGEDDLHPEGFHAASAGERVGSMMSPTLVFEGAAVRLVAGSGGSKRIRSAMVQVITAVLDFGMDLCSAVEAPRLHWDGEHVQAEPGFSPAALEALRARWPVNTWDERNLYFGGVHAVTPGIAAAGDPRREGHGRVVPTPDD